jgi:hypothetical protein
MDIFCSAIALNHLGRLSISIELYVCFMHCEVALE